MNDKLCPNCPIYPNLPFFIPYLLVTVVFSVRTKLGQLRTKLGQIGQKGQGQKNFCLGEVLFHA